MARIEPGNAGEIVNNGGDMDKLMSDAQIKGSFLLSSK